MIGIIINSILIVVGGVLGLLVGNRISDKVQSFMMSALGLCIIFLGIQMALEVRQVSVVLCAVTAGAAIGQALEIDEKLVVWGNRIDAKFAKGDGPKPMAAFIATSLVYCIGSMAILGPLQAGLTGNIDTLLVKGILDGVSAVIFATTLGVGVLLSSISVFGVQTLIFLFAKILAPFLTDAVMQDLTSAGGIIVMGIGIKMFFDKKDLPVANFLPAIPIPVIVYGVASLLGFTL